METPMTSAERAVWEVIQVSMDEGSSSDEVHADAMAIARTLGVPSDRVKALIREARAKRMTGT